MQENFFNDDGDPRNGCEAGCPSVQGGTCEAPCREREIEIVTRSY